MSKKYTAKNIKLEDFVLDKENPRFAELYSGSDKESDIVEYLLYTESADEIAKAISEAGEFYEDRPLWVFKKDGKYIVKDGNRRCSAVKALQLPNKYGLEIPKFEINELPVLEYNDLSDLETRIRLEHNSSLFKKWGRIAKALEIYRLFSSGNSVESLTEIDSKPKDFIKTATFYHKAVDIKGEDFKKLVREGRGKTGKTIIFERLFREIKKCGYSFKHTGETFIKDNSLFESYINAIVPYLIENPNLDTSRTIDKNGTDNFLLKLKRYGFPPEKTATTNTQNTSSASNSTSSGATTTNTSNVTNDSDITKKEQVKINPKSTSRKYLIPKNCRLTIGQDKINSIYLELRGDLLLDDSDKSVPNAVGVLFRVFLEISLNEYAEKNGGLFNKEVNILKKKIPCVVKSLQSKGYESQKFREINKVGSAENEKSFLSIERFHEYVHSKTVQASPQELKTKWDLLQPFFELLWGDLNKKGK